MHLAVLRVEEVQCFKEKTNCYETSPCEKIHVDRAWRAVGSPVRRRHAPRDAGVADTCRIAASGAWKDAKTLRVRWFLVGGIQKGEFEVKAQ